MIMRIPSCLLIPLIYAAMALSLGCTKAPENAPIAESQPIQADKPNPTVSVVWFSVKDKPLTIMRFLAPIKNPSDRPVSGVVTEWIAYDAEGAIVGAKKSRRPTIPANGELPYVGGASSVHLSGNPVRVTVRIVDPGQFVTNGGPTIQTKDVTFKRGYFGIYEVNAKASSDIELRSAELNGFVLLYDASGKVIGADFWEATNLPETIPAGTTFNVKQGFFLSLKEKPSSATVTVVAGPESD